MSKRTREDMLSVYDEIEVRVEKIGLNRDLDFFAIAQIHEDITSSVLKKNGWNLDKYTDVTGHLDEIEREVRRS